MTSLKFARGENYRNSSGRSAAAASCGNRRNDTRRRSYRLPDGLQLCVRLPHRRQACHGPHPPHPAYRQKPQLHAGVQRSVRNQHLRQGRQLGVSHAQVNDSRPVYVHSAGDAGGAETAPAPQAAYDRAAGTGSSTGTGGSRCARRADHEFDAIAARRPVAVDGPGPHLDTEGGDALRRGRIASAVRGNR